MKRILVVIGMFALLSLSSCKENDDALARGVFAITGGWAQTGWPPDGTALFQLYAGVISKNEIAGTITSWKFVFEVDGREILEINDRNFTSYAPYIVTDAAVDSGNRFIIPAGQKISFQLTQNSGDNHFVCPWYMLPERPFDLEIVLAIQDENSHVSICEYKTRVIFSYF